MSCKPNQGKDILPIHSYWRILPLSLCRSLWRKQYLFFRRLFTILFKAFSYACRMYTDRQRCGVYKTPAIRRDNLTLFKKVLKEYGIRHKLIRPFTPRHNGNVERSYCKDNERFYATHSFYSFEDFAAQLKVYNRRDCNLFPMRPLGWKSPLAVLRNFIYFSVTYVWQTYRDMAVMPYIVVENSSILW